MNYMFTSKKIAAFILTSAIVSSLFFINKASAVNYTVTNTKDSGVGSLRQAIIDSNSNCTALNNITFNIPSTEPASSSITTGGKVVYAGGTYFRIVLLSSLPAITCSNVVIDGSSQTTFGGDTNPGLEGSGGTVGVQSLALNKVEKPEIEIRPNFTQPTTKSYGIESNASNVTVKGLAILGFGLPNQSGDIGFLNTTGGNVQNNFLGFSAEGMVDPGVGVRGRANGVYVENAPGVKISGNILAFHDMTGVFIYSGVQNNITIENNEIAYNNRAQNLSGPGIGITEGTEAKNGLIKNNLIKGQDAKAPSAFADNDYADFGIEITSPVTAANKGGFSIENNTLTDNASAIVVAGGTNNIVKENIIYSNVGKGIIVQGKKNTITQNSFYQNDNGVQTNAGLAIDLNGDGVTLNDLNDADSNGNDGYNFPVFESVVLDAGSITVKGFSRPGAKIELFIADEDPTGFGEGKTYLANMIEGSVADLDSTSGSYSGAIGGHTVGADNTSKFNFIIPVGSLTTAVVTGTKLTATATGVDGSTSEFSGIIPVTLPVPLNNVLAKDDSSSTQVNTPVNINVFTNDNDPQGDTFELTVPLAEVTTFHGKVTCTKLGICTYTPANGYVGNDTFEYTITDSKGAIAKAIVTITITSAAPANTVLAVNDTSVTQINVPVTINVLTNDSDPQGDTFELTSPLNNVATAQGGTAKCTATGSCLYTPKTGYVGVDTFPYSIKDSKGAIANATVTITINPLGVNTVVAKDDSATTPLNTLININVFTNDSDPQGDTFELTTLGLTSTTQGGTVTCGSTGVCTYVPKSGYVGVDTFTYTIKDSKGATSTAVVTITITNTTPVVSGGGGGGVPFCGVVVSCGSSSNTTPTSTTPTSVPTPSTQAPSPSLPATSLRIGSLIGYVFYDNNNNGIEDAGDKPAENITVSIQGAGKNNVVTKKDGSFEANELEGNVFAYISETQPGVLGYKVTTDGSKGKLLQEYVVTSDKIAIGEKIGLYKAVSRAQLYDTDSQSKKEVYMGIVFIVLAGLVAFSNRFNKIATV